MKSLTFSATIVSIMFLFLACGPQTPKDYSKEVDEGTFSGNIFTSKTLGWSMEFPSNWIITSKKSLENLDSRSKEISGDSSNMSGVNRTLAFQKNFNNNFQSTWENFEGDETAYKTRIYEIRSMIYENYLNQKITMDTAGTNIQVGQVKFDCFTLALFDRSHKNYSTQLLLTSLRNGKFMTVTITSDNKEDQEKMLGLFKKSTFN
ncbi:MAG TPA: hypothetical protein PLI97_03515 [Fluviicola sp.]|nr:hypothetical protein [Fluviicola sp.]